jgi:hypothetical protein
MPDRPGFEYTLGAAVRDSQSRCKSSAAMCGPEAGIRLTPCAHGSQGWIA